MLENVKKLLDKDDVSYTLNDTDKEEVITFGLELSFSSVNVEFSYDKVEKMYRFYTELLEFNDESYEDGLGLVNDINYNAIYLKSYLDDDNVLCAEYYLDGENKLTDSLIDDLLSDLVNLEELLEEYI